MQFIAINAVCAFSHKQKGTHQLVPDIKYQCNGRDKNICYQTVVEPMNTCNYAFFCFLLRYRWSMPTLIAFKIVRRIVRKAKKTRSVDHLPKGAYRQEVIFESIETSNHIIMVDKNLVTCSNDRWNNCWWWKVGSYQVTIYKKETQATKASICWRPTSPTCSAKTTITHSSLFHHF